MPRELWIFSGWRRCLEHSRVSTSGLIIRLQFRPSCWNQGNQRLATESYSTVTRQVLMWMHLALMVRRCWCLRPNRPDCTFDEALRSTFCENRSVEGPCPERSERDIERPWKFDFGAGQVESNKLEIVQAMVNQRAELNLKAGVLKPADGLNYHMFVWVVFFRWYRHTLFFYILSHYCLHRLRMSLWKLRDAVWHFVAGVFFCY